MSEKKEKNNIFAGLGKIASNVSEKAKEVSAKSQEVIMTALDKNQDGSIDFTDFGITEERIQATKEKTQQLAEKAEQSLKSGAEQVNKTIVDVKDEWDRKQLRPVFQEELDLSVNLPYSIVCIVDPDKRHSESEVCKGSIGHLETIKNVEVLYLYEEYANQLGFMFYPMITQSIYYNNPFQKNYYIALDDYFDFFKKHRINELEEIAQTLGAKHFKVTFKEIKKTHVSNKANAVFKVKKSNKADASAEGVQNEYSNLEITSDVKFEGQAEPSNPSLIYFINDPDIQALIQMRMNKNNRMTSKVCSLKSERSFGMSAKAAANIDVVLSSLKCSGNTSISSEVERENRTIIDYYIEF